MFLNPRLVFTSKGMRNRGFCQIFRCLNLTSLVGLGPLNDQGRLLVRAFEMRPESGSMP